MPRPALVLVLLCLLSVAACSRDEAQDPKPSGERTREPVPEVPKDAPSGPFAAFDFDATAKRWQGAWVLTGEATGEVVAWSVAGDRVTQSGADGAALDYGFTVYSPCQVAYTDEAGGVTTYKTFAFVGDALHAGPGAAGVELEGSTVVCTADGRIFALAEGRCLAWSELFDDWKSKPAKCGIEGSAAARVFVVGEERLNFVSGAWLDAAMAAQVAERHPDFAAAKAALGEHGR